jgi:hypothetical protein
VLVVEDLHWADELSLDFLDHLVDWAAGVPLLVVATARPELLARRPGWGGGKANSTSMALSPLGPQDTARLVADLLGQVLLPAEVQAALLARAGGNPLYAEEYVRMLSDRRFLRRVGGSWRLERAEELPLPESVEGIIAARLDALGPDDKESRIVLGDLPRGVRAPGRGPPDGRAVRVGRGPALAAGRAGLAGLRPGPLGRGPPWPRPVPGRGRGGLAPFHGGLRPAAPGGDAAGPG